MFKLYIQQFYNKCWGRRNRNGIQPPYIYLIFQCVLNTFSYNDIQVAINEKKKKGRNMTSAERKWTISEEKRRQELIKRNGKELVSIGKSNF